MIFWLNIAFKVPNIASQALNIAPRAINIAPQAINTAQTALKSPNLYLIVRLLWCEMSSKYKYTIELRVCGGGGGKQKNYPSPLAFTAKNFLLGLLKTKNSVFLITVKYKY